MALILSILLCAAGAEAGGPPAQRIDLLWTLTALDVPSGNAHTMRGHGREDLPRDTVAAGWACRADAFQLAEVAVVTLSCFAGEHAVNLSAHTRIAPWVTADVTFDHLAVKITAPRQLP